MFAVIIINKNQHKVTEGEIFKTQKLKMEVGDKFSADEVLLLASEEKGDVKIGTPVLESQIELEVIEHGKEKKIRVFKMKAKKRYSRTQGHRQNFTKVKVLKIGTVTAKKVIEKTEEKE